MTEHNVDDTCPKCGEPIGQTATYCLHCSADLTGGRESTTTDRDGRWSQTETTATVSRESTADPRATAPSGTEPDVESGRMRTDSIDSSSATADEAVEHLLSPDGVADNILTNVVGIFSGIVVGAMGMSMLSLVTGSGLSIIFGFISGVGTTIYLSRCRTVENALVKSVYPGAIVLLSVPVLALSPVVGTEGGSRSIFSMLMLGLAVVNGGITAVIGWKVSQSLFPKGTE